MAIIRVVPIHPRLLIGKLSKAGYSQTYIAHKVGVVQSTISRLASGNAPDCQYSLVVSLFNLVVKHNLE